MFYPGETIRLLLDVPEPPLAQGTEGTVQEMVYDGQGRPTAVAASLSTKAGNVRATLPREAVEPVISTGTQERTAVLWGVDLAPQQMIEAAMHSVLDRGFLMREGLNVARLHYDRLSHWWKWGERMADPAGAQVVAAAGAWDGVVVGFSGSQRFQLELHLAGRGEPCLLLHERDAAYNEQMRGTEPAMSLARVLVNLYSDLQARFCACPVADPWLMDEDWGSLLRAPYYPDLFLLPDAAIPTDCPDGFRVARLTHNRVMLTVLPVKFEPGETPPPRTERDLMEDRLRKCQALGEKYYDQMYESRHGTTGLYSSAKDAFADAIAAAEQLGLREEAGRLSERLAHIKNVYRSQFT